jgi:hypothetical protein
MSRWTRARLTARATTAFGKADNESNRKVSVLWLA